MTRGARRQQSTMPSVPSVSPSGPQLLSQVVAPPAHTNDCRPVHATKTETEESPAEKISQKGGPWDPRRACEIISHQDSGGGGL